MRKVKLGGWLGKKFVKEIELEVNSVGEAVQALRANYPEFERLFCEYRPGYHVFIDERNIGEDELGMLSAGVIRIVPVVQGAGDDGGIFQTILGVAMIVVGAITWGAGGWQLVAAGVGMVAGGIMQMLQKTPEAAKDGEDKTRTSFAFNGAINTSAAGNPVQVLYGRMIIGSQVISTNMKTIQGYAEPEPEKPTSSTQFGGYAWNKPIGIIGSGDSR